MGKFCELKQLTSEQIERRCATALTRQQPYPSDLALLREQRFDGKYGQCQRDTILSSLEKRAPTIAQHPLTNPLITLLLEASLDYKLAFYEELNLLVTALNTNGSTKTIEDKIAAVANEEERLRRQQEADETEAYAARIRSEAIKAVFGK